MMGGGVVLARVLVLPPCSLHETYMLNAQNYH